MFLNLGQSDDFTGVFYGSSPNPKCQNLYLNLITKSYNKHRDILHGGKSEIDSYGEALGF